MNLMMPSSKLCLLLLAAAANPTTSLPTYGDLIPNGRSVPNPGPQGGVWAGVGHENAAGGGPRNLFGRDFKEANFTWTEALCQMDSDGDGRTNGEELGDPDCVWMPGDDVDGPALSHPGKQDVVPNGTTTTSVDTCTDYEDPEDVQVLNISFGTPNILNSTRTHYRCEQLRVAPPQNINEQFLVKSDVILSNPKVLHHIWVYHCVTGEASSDGNRVGEGTYECNGIEANCQIVAGWAVGPESYCEPPNVAAYVDWSLSDVFKIEAHYDNSEGLDGVQDQSGMSLRLTPTPRPLDSGLVILGMDYYDRQFTVPAQQDSTSLTNICPTEATLRGLGHPVYVYSWNPHMHLYGKKLVTEHWRCGVKIGEIGRIDDFEFDNQQTYALIPPVKVLPGDALVTTCTYNTSNTEEDVIGGEQTTEEMCDNYLAYYPFAGTNWEPNLFSACSSFDEGLNPAYIGYDDYAPFTSLDLAGDAYIEYWNSDPAHNIAPCCATNTCEIDYLAKKGEPCGVTTDCQDGLICDGGLCGEESPAPTMTPVTKSGSSSSSTQDSEETLKSSDEEQTGGTSSSPAPSLNLSFCSLGAALCLMSLIFDA